jgi:hypothetical protein
LAVEVVPPLSGGNLLLLHFCLDFEFDLYQMEMVGFMKVFSSNVLVSSDLSYYINFLIQADSLYFQIIVESLLLFCEDNYINVSCIQICMIGCVSL